MIDKNLLYGLILGFTFILIRLGFVEVTQDLRNLVYFLGISFATLGFFIKIMKSLQKGAVFSRKWDNFFIGFGLSITIVSFLLTGPNFP